MPTETKVLPPPTVPTISQKVAPTAPANAVPRDTPADGGLRTSNVPRVLPEIVNGSSNRLPTPVPTPMPAPTPAPVSVPGEESTAPDHAWPAMLPKIADPAVSRGAVPPAHANLYHSPDYSVLVGELQYNTRLGVWRLRYAGLDEEDRYGGSVTLDSMGRQMEDFKTGQTIRVEGALADPHSRDISPAYRVRDLRPNNP
jgi:hypothetical protein